MNEYALKKLAYNLLGHEIRKRNRPISTVIKEFLDKKGGNVVTARKEIEWRFDALDWRYQKQILFAFLQSGKSDRVWAYKKLLVLWDDCFIPVLQELWEKHHEMQLSWVVIQYFPMEYLKKKFVHLSVFGRNYFFLCQRLLEEKDFVLDRARLNEPDLLMVKSRLGEKIADDYVMDLFFLMIYKICKQDYYFMDWVIAEKDGNRPLLTIFESRIVRNMQRVVEYELGRRYLVQQMKDWMHSVTDGFLNEYKGEYYESWYTYDKKDFFRQLIKEYCCHQIDAEYRKVWDNFDCTNQQQFLDYLDMRHKEHILRDVSIQQMESGLDLEILKSTVTSEFNDVFDGEIQGFQWDNQEIEMPF